MRTWRERAEAALAWAVVAAVGGVLLLAYASPEVLGFLAEDAGALVGSLGDAAAALGS
jgi:hypothetical protein